MTPQPPQHPSRPQPPLEETDPRFPSGPWRGFFLMDHWPGRHQMELLLSFRQGVMTGEGRDRIGSFLIRGQYNLDDGKCHWTKRYIGKHDVAYQGYNEGKGIWGLWEIPPSSRGGFHIWPTAMGDPTSPHLAEAIDTPGETQVEPEVEIGVGVAEPEPVGASAEAERGGCFWDGPARNRVGLRSWRDPQGSRRRGSPRESSQIGAALRPDAAKAFEASFQQLAAAWKAETAPLSSVRQKRQHPAIARSSRWENRRSLSSWRT